MHNDDTDWELKIKYIDLMNKFDKNALINCLNFYEVFSTQEITSEQLYEYCINNKIIREEGYNEEDSTIK